MTAEIGRVEIIRAGLAPYGFSLRGHVNFTGEGPLLKSGQQAGSLVLVGFVGGALWPAFETWRAKQGSCDQDHPLDLFSKAVIGPLAERAGGTAYYPSDQPWQPFQGWAMRAEGLKASPLGILIHPVYGLWHGYRGAVAFAEPLEPPVGEPLNSPCDSCLARPCVSACPADAITAEGFQFAPCRSHLAARQGRSGCMQKGCLSRNACPVGSEFRYSDAQLRFHMQALSI